MSSPDLSSDVPSAESGLAESGFAERGLAELTPEEIQACLKVLNTIHA